MKGHNHKNYMEYYFHLSNYGLEIANHRNSHMGRFITINVSILTIVSILFGFKGSLMIPIKPVTIIVFVSLVGVALNLVWFRISESLRGSSMVNYQKTIAMEREFPSELKPFAFHTANNTKNYRRKSKQIIGADEKKSRFDILYEKHVVTGILPVRLLFALTGWFRETPSQIMLAFPAFFVLGFAAIAVCAHVFVGEASPAL